MLQDYKKFLLSGNVYIKYYDEPVSLVQGDIRLFLHDDSIRTFQGDYETTSYSGYLKGEVYDGKHWQLLDFDEFFDDREYKYGKKQRPLDTAILCQEMLANFRNEEIYRTYRGHFTRHEYTQEVRITKANRGRKK
jgi:hypothetical protein